MSKFATDLKWIRQQLEHAQAVTDGQKSLGAKVVWDEQNQDSVSLPKYKQRTTTSQNHCYK